jgi:thioredoxin 1
MRTVTDETFEADVLRSARPVVVDFGAPWCAPCKAIAPALARLEGELPGVDFVEIDVDANPVTASRYDVLSLPTVAVFSGGELRRTVVGARSYKHYEKELSAEMLPATE